MIRNFNLIAVLIAGLLLSACGNDADVKDNGMGEFLPVEKAFVFTIKSAGNNTIKAHWEIADGYHLYKEKFEFALANDDYQIATLDIPKGKMIEDKVFGNKESYEDALDITIALKEINKSGIAKVTVGYQGCSSKGLCYPPQSIETEIAL